MKTVHPVNISLSLILGMMLCMAPGCKKREAASDVPPTTANAKKPTPVEAQAEGAVRSAADSNSVTVLPYEVLPSVGVGSIRFGMSGENVMKEMGKPDKVEDGGMSFVYSSKGFSLMVHPRRGVQHFNFYTRKAAPPFYRGQRFWRQDQGGDFHGGQSV